jgi:hypothetical protein
MRENKYQDDSIEIDTSKNVDHAIIDTTLKNSLMAQHFVDTARIKSQSDQKLIDFSSIRIEWTEDERQKGISRIAQEFVVVDSLETSFSIEYTIRGTGPGALYKGNIEIDSSTVYLYYWIDESQDVSFSRLKWELKYTIEKLDHSRKAIIVEI